MTMRKHRGKKRNRGIEQPQNIVSEPIDIEEELPFLLKSTKRDRSSDKREAERSDKTAEGTEAGIHLFHVSDESEEGLKNPSGQELQQDSFSDEIDMEPDIPTDGHDEPDVYSERKYIVLIIYDIISNKQRVKMAKLLSGYGNRVQKSAFEARLNKKQYARLLRDIKKMLKQDDNVRIYKLYGYEEILTFGDKEYEIIEDVIVI